MKEPCRVISVDNFITGMKYDIEEGPNFRTINHDIKNALSIDERIDYIIHAAGIGSPKFYRIYKLETIDVGVLGTSNALKLAQEKGVESFMFLSSSEIYGDPDPKYVPTPETYNGNVSCTGPRANYDESKRLGETLCVVYNEMHNVPVKMVRPFNVYGPGMRVDDHRVVPNFVGHIIRGEPLPVYGDGRQTRTFCYVTDAIVGCFKVLLSDCNRESFNVGIDKEEVSIAELVEILAELFDAKLEVRSVAGLNDAYGSSEPKRRAPNLDKIRAMLEYEPVLFMARTPRVPTRGLETGAAWSRDVGCLKRRAQHVGVARWHASVPSPGSRLSVDS